MSASLVGSEMCIRDRAAEGQRVDEAGEHEVVAHGLAGGRRSAAQLLRHPVSYTHLTLPTICSV
eukprot:5268626-Alexandrium_andersonii.AAC.1